MPGVCERCGQPYLVRYAAAPGPEAKALLRERGWTMWRYREWLPLAEDEVPVTLGEGATPLLRLARLGPKYGFERLVVKDEGVNPTGSFKARGLAAAVTRAVLARAKTFVVPTAGNAGVALSAYAARAGVRARVYAPRSTPRMILNQIARYGAELELIDGHIGDCGKAARAFAAETGAVDVSTLREPYRIEGKKTLGLELAEQLRWTLPDAIVYPTGGGTGLIGMWKAFQELRDAGWVEPWPNPETVAAGLRVPGPLGDRLMLRALRESHGGAVAVADDVLTAAAAELQVVEGVDAAPEGGAALAAAVALRRSGALRADDQVVVFNTGAGWLYQA